MVDEAHSIGVLGETGHGIEEHYGLPPDSVDKLVAKLKTQKGITIDYRRIPGADHFFADHLGQLIGNIEDYLNQRLGPVD